MNNSLKQSIRNIFHLGVKEIRSLMRDLLFSHIVNNVFVKTEVKNCVHHTRH